MKLCFLCIMPSPYMEDIFTALNTTSEMEIKVLYEAMVVQDTLWGDRELPHYAKLIGPDSASPPRRRWSYNSGIITDLEQAEADLYIVQGYSSLTDQVAFRWLIKNRKRWVFWGERPGLKRRGLLGQWLRDQAMRPVLQSADAIVGIGQLAVEKYRKLLIRDLPVENIPYLCQLDQFMAAAERRQVSEESTVNSPVTILYCGQLIHRKGLDTLFQAFQSLYAQNQNIKLRLVGTGPDEPALKSLLSEAEQDAVEFTGFQPVDALPDLFATADIFVLPSRHDGWGVVVNQALASGLPLVCSDQVGAGYDLIQDGVNGYQFPVEDWKALAEKLQKLMNNPEKRKRMSLASRQEAERWTPERGAELWKELASNLTQPTIKTAPSAS
jgi:glycosyltransferase involved in cell wall biosynthesis